MLNISAEHKKEHLYLEVYHYYRKLIMEERLLPGSKMPSLRKCAQELKLSRTTIENAYLQLAADGYIIARAQSGYYVTDIATKLIYFNAQKKASITAQSPNPLTKGLCLCFPYCFSSVFSES